MPRSAITFADLVERANLTQRTIAVVLNKREATVSDWVRNARYPNLTFAEILQLQLLLSCTLEELSLCFDNFDTEDARRRIEERMRLME